MSDPIRFDELRDSDYGALLLPRRPLTFEVSLRTMGYGDEARPTMEPDTPHHLGARPPPEARTDAAALDAYVCEGGSRYARWIRFNNAVAALGGQVRFQPPEEESVIARVSFRQPEVGDEVVRGAEKPLLVVGVGDASVELCAEDACDPGERDHPHTTLARSALLWNQDRRMWDARETA